MVPSAVVSLAAWPLNSSGKVDRKKLPAAGMTGPDVVPAQGSMEVAICAVFSKVTKVAQVGRNTGFFALGGDSILAIRVVTIARTHGIQITVAQLMQHHTPAQLAKVAKVASNTSLQVVAEDGPVSGEFVLTPTQRWFFSTDFAQASHWNQAISLQFNAEVKLDASKLQNALRTIGSHHDMLRCRYSIDQDGRWIQFIPKAGENAVPELKTIVAATATEEHTALTQLQASLDLECGPVWCAAIVSAPGKADRVVLGFHHLVVDAVSWRILEEDLASAYYGQPLPRKTTSFATWAKHLEEFMGSQDSWVPPCAPQLAHSAVTLKAHERMMKQQSSIDVRISSKLTEQLLTTANSAFNTRPQELMLAALALGYREWCGEKRLGVLLEGHGRTPIDSTVDISRTVGWFTAMWPVILEIEVNNTSQQRYVTSAICSVKDQLRNLPERIQNYGMAFNTSAECNGLPELAFNYLGQFNGGPDSEETRGATLGVEDEELGEEVGIGNHVAEKLALNGLVSNGVLSMTWSFDSVEYSEDQIQRFATAWQQAMTRVIDAGMDTSLSQQTPSDWPFCGLTQTELDSVLSRMHAQHTTSSIMKLTSLQSGLVAGTLVDPTAYVVQSVSVVHGVFEEQRLRQAWEQVASVVDVLRTRVYLEGLVHPVQVVLEGQGPFVGWEHIHVPQQDGTTQSTFVQDVATKERTKSFVFENSPLLRVMVVEGDESVHIVITQHHCILDGWSSAMLQHSVLSAYHGHTPAVRSPFAKAVERLLQTNSKDAEKFWKRTLHGFTQSNELCFASATSLVDQTHDVLELRTDITKSHAQAQAAAMGVTIASIVNALGHC